MDSEELNDRIVKLENQMSVLKILLPQFIDCFHLIKELLRPLPQAEATASASAPKELDVGSNGRPVSNDGPSDAPDVEELNPVIPKIVARREEDRNNKRIAKLEEKLRLLQGLDGIEDLSYYAKFQVPETFKMPKFNKYDSSGNPIVHLNHFMMKMARHAENAPLMILAFQYSLTGPALQWFFMRRVHMLDTWEEVSDAFLLQYKFNADLAPARDDLRRAEMKRGESFGAYARRWHSLAAQVWPALSDKEMTDLFVRTLPLEYFIRMIGCDTFPNIVMVGERIEGAIRDGQLAA
ncbi:uncharacterized protein LOC115671527 [Syzygium oleosum]|uniref:uncharacterized protein LOC115671527 n=1 Tax=Syzygium oleosum TaxID=219896 RepID=UPI0024BA1871|nr:uncharacterized protein LOC115671527 [Syzygium oleosum]